MKRTPGELAGLIDHTLLKPEATARQISELCREAVEYGFKAVCLNPCYVALATRELNRAPVLVCSVVGFPLGAASARIKAEEALLAINEGAREIDTVMNIGYLKSGMIKETSADLAEVISRVKRENPATIVKVILETCLLTDEEKITACRLVMEAGGDYVKTSTGFNVSGARVEDIKLMRQTVGANIGIKAAGGVNNLNAALSMLEAGATRLGASAGVRIINEMQR